MEADLHDLMILGLEKILQLIYPSCCHHCGLVMGGQTLFCPNCQTDFALLDPEGRCPFCFTENLGPCTSCRTQRKWRVHPAAVLEHRGSVKAFIREVRRGRAIQTAVSFLLIQHARLQWDVPDRIIPIPSRGSTQFVKAFAKALQVPHLDCIKRQRGELPQMRLPAEERMRMTESSFVRRGQESCEGMYLLLIDDVIGTGQTIRSVAAHFPEARRIDALALTLRHESV